MALANAAETGSQQARRLPWDVGLVLLLVALSLAVGSLDAGAPLRVALAFVALVFLPGFALTTLVFPGRTSHRAAPTDRTIPSLDTVERLALSVGLSVVVVITTAFVLSQTAFGLELPTLVAAVALVTGTLAVLGAIRRLRVPAPYRFAVVPREQYGAIRNWRRETPPVDVALTLVLVVAVVGSLAGLGFALVSPQSGEAYTDFQLLTEENGQLIAGGYPTELTRNQPAALVFAVSNFEGEAATYTVVVQLQRVNAEGQVTNAAELDRFEGTVQAGDRWVLPHTVTPTVAGDDLRIAYLLYKSDPPATPSQSNAYRQLYIWVTVAEEA
ncbi:MULTISPECIES: DUF1616 domain-containing protein [unclassified Haladaptatus]|uniref:DUF1616 domain-containing protein n=1 Tax=unclassified Haladaptatus TaxID=2622732 RepID=UPI0023E86451|nr:MULTISPECIES: DUF1616 domain-containing protein [unclassified Haladaptatus]